MHSVFGRFGSAANLHFQSELVKVGGDKQQEFPSSLLLSNTNSPSFTYSIQNNLKRFPELKFFGLWLTIFTIERGEWLCLKNVALASPFVVHSFFKRLGNFHDHKQEENWGNVISLLDSYLKGYGGVKISNYYSRHTVFVHSSECRTKAGRISIYRQAFNQEVVIGGVKIFYQISETQPNWVSCGCAVCVVISLR